MTTQPEPSIPGPHGGSVAGELAQLRSVVKAMTQTLWAARGRDELMDTVAEAEALKSTVDALVLEVVRELDATGAVKPAGWASTQDFVTAVAGGHKGTGPATVRLAAAVEDRILAPVAEALGDGWLSVAKAQVIERAVDTLPGERDLRQRGVAFLLGEAKALDATELKKLTRHLISVVDPDGEERRAERELDRLERAAHHDRYLSITDDQAGGAWIKGRCSSEDAELVKATLIPLAAPQPAAGPVCDPPACVVPGCGHDGRDPRDHGARLLDALVEACARLQSAELLPESHGAVPRLTLTMDYDDLRTRTGCAVTETGAELSASAVRRICCDSHLIPAVLGTASEVLDVGRTQRLVTAAIWKALVARDTHCRFPNCRRPPVMCHAHHLTHWADGGHTALDNLILLCGHHHRLIHNGPWTIEPAGPAAFEFHPPPGTRRRRRPDGEPPDNAPPDHSPPDG